MAERVLTEWGLPGVEQLRGQVSVLVIVGILSFSTTVDAVAAAEDPDLYCYLVGKLNKLGLAYVHLMHLGDDALLADVRKGWDSSSCPRPTSPRG